MIVSRRFDLQRKFAKQTLLVKALVVLVGLVIVGYLFSFILFAWYSRDLPAPGKLTAATSASTVFLDRDDRVLFELSKDKNRVPVKLKDISLRLKQATVAIEDKNFYRHKGVSRTGIVRAIFSTLLKGRVQGGSTITQQLIKNVLLDSTRTFSRKFKEITLASEVERRYTKDQILEMYLNEAPYGGTFWGVESAAMGYFGKASSELNLTESAFIAGLPQSPSIYSPFIGRRDAWKSRTRDVLRRMREDRYITRKEETEALARLDTLKFSEARLSINAPHFVFFVREQLEREFGNKILDQGLKVKTTLSLDVQRATQKVVNEEVKKLKGFNATNGAAVVMDSKTGEILAMVGSYDFNNRDFGKFNAAVGLRQPGSAIKPITYAAAFEKGYTPSTVVMDTATTFPNQGDKEYKPVNYDGRFRGPVQLRFALGNSINMSAVKLLAMVGVRNFLSKASDMGLETLEPSTRNLNRFGLAITLGGGEVTLLDLTNAYSTFARAGVARDHQSIIEVRNHKGRRIYKAPQNRGRKVLTPESSFLVSHILSDNNARSEVFGPNSYLRVPGRTTAVKTGTTDDKRDNWTVGYTKSLTVGVWVGNNDNSPMNPRIASGVTGASPIWQRIMIQLLNSRDRGRLKYQDGIPDQPARIKSLEVDAYLGGLPREGYPKRSEYFIEGTEPKDISNFYKKLKISKSTRKLANDVEIKQGDYEEKDYIVITENDPVSTDGKNRWQEGIYAWQDSQGDEKLKPPRDVSDASVDNIVVSIKSPGDRSTVSTNDVQIKAKITSVSGIKNVKIYINGTERKNWDEDKKEVEETINLPDGVYEIKVTARNDRDKTGESTIKIGVNRPWDSGSSTPTPTSAP